MPPLARDSAASPPAASCRADFLSSPARSGAAAGLFFSGKAAASGGPSPAASLAQGGAAAAHPEIGPILSAAESLFAAMGRRDASAIFSLLTKRSRETIVEETLRASREAAGRSGGEVKGKGLPPSRDEVADDFARGGPISRAYWEGFSRKFDPDEALARSRWEIGRIDRDRAVVVITHADSDKPAVVRMFREEGTWKVGLLETFWTR